MSHARSHPRCQPSTRGDRRGWGLRHQEFWFLHGDLLLHIADDLSSFRSKKGRNFSTPPPVQSRKKKERRGMVDSTDFFARREGGGRSQKTAATYVGRGREGIDVGSLLFSRRFPLYGKKKKMQRRNFTSLPFLFLSIRRRLNNHMEEFHLPD